MDSFPKSNPALRYLVFVLSTVFLVLGVIAFFQDPQGLSVPVYILGGIGIVFLLVFLFGSEDLCYGVCLLVTFGVWG